jgi:signal transduction histidine kinase
VKDINGNPQNLGTIIIKPHFYETVFFYISVILFFMLLGGLIFFIFYRVRLQRILLAQRIRNKIASDLHDDIGSSLNSISVYSEIVKRSLKEADPKTMRAVESMGSTSRQMIDNMSDIVWAINQKNDDFEQILQRMKHFAGELLAEKHMVLQFNYDERVKKIKLPMEKRKSFYLIYKEAINNAYKYSEAKNVDVQLQLTNNELKMTISDDGKGFNDVKTGLGGNGLKSMKARADEVKAKLDIKSGAGKGTQVYLNLHVK